MGFVPQRYLDEAEREKAQYARDLKEYQQTEAYQITSAKIQDKKVKKGKHTLSPFPLSPHNKRMCTLKRSLRNERVRERAGRIFSNVPLPPPSLSS